jgi:amino acid transporter
MTEITKQTILILLIVIAICIILWFYVTAFIQWGANNYFDKKYPNGNYGYNVTIALFATIGVVSAIFFLGLLSCCNFSSLNSNPLDKSHQYGVSQPAAIQYGMPQYAMPQYAAPQYSDEFY